MRAARAARSGTVSLRSVWLNMQLTSLYLAILIGSLEATQQGASWAPDAHQHGSGGGPDADHARARVRRPQGLLSTMTGSDSVLSTRSTRTRSCYTSRTRRAWASRTTGVDRTRNGSSRCPILTGQWRTQPLAGTSASQARPLGTRPSASRASPARRRRPRSSPPPRARTRSSILPRPRARARARAARAHSSPGRQLRRDRTRPRPQELQQVPAHRSALLQGARAPCCRCRQGRLRADRRQQRRCPHQGAVPSSVRASPRDRHEFDSLAAPVCRRGG